MKLTLKRIALKPTYTIGKLYIDGVYFCDTLEDAVREKKIPNITAIPYGTYKVTLRVRSPRFSTKAAFNWCSGYLPRLINVPNFDGILIHSGNSARDSSGCILVGRNTTVGHLSESMTTLKKLYPILKKAEHVGDSISIEIV